MRAPGKHQQHGYMLILTLLMFMGIGGVVLASFTQQARHDLEERKYQHNQRVLEEAKRALLLFAYNYPQSNPGIGPGRLPCPDLDNNGLVDPVPCNQVGRFPWDDWRLDTPQLRDASGETLWYAVTDSFDNVGGGGVINSDTQGNITLLDRNGQILYDGRAGGLAAVIIAPGERLRRDNDRDGVYEYEQVRVDPIIDQRNPVNYLDTYTIVDTVPDPDVVVASYDNSVFSNDEFNSDDDPLIIGPIFDPLQSEIVVNDQMIIVTADEVIAMAEKAVLDAYRDAVVDYQQTLWGTPADYRYPWLSAWDDTNDLEVYNPQVGSTSGRVPMFDYFVDENSPHSIVVNDLQIFFDLHITYNSMVDNLDPFDPTYIAAAVDVVNNYPESDQTINISNARVTFSRTSFNGAADVTTDSVGTLIVDDNNGAAAITATTYGPNRVRRYFWDGCPTCFEAADGWEMCPFIAGNGEDCAKDENPPYNFEGFTDWDDHADIALRMIEFEYIDANFVLELDYTPAPAVTAPTLPTAASHSRRQYTFAENEVTAMPIIDPAEPDSRNFFDIRVSMCDQDNFVGSGLNLVSLGNPDSGTVDCIAGVDLELDVDSNYHDDLVITVDWHPQLPRWVSDNGWDEAVMMSYMPDFAPGGDGACTADADPATPAADDCLVINNLAGANNDFSAVLILAGEHDLVDDAADNFGNDLQDIFEPENYSGLWPHPVPNNDPTPASDSQLPRIFDKREETVPGNRPDKLFVVN